MTRPSVSQAEAWRPEELRRLAEAWDQTARALHVHLRGAVAVLPDAWIGASADEAGARLRAFVARGDEIARALVLAAVAARDGADQLTGAQGRVADLVDLARRDGFRVGDEGSVVPDHPPSSLLILLSGSDVQVANDLL